MIRLKDITLRNIFQFSIGMFRYDLFECLPKLHKLLIRKHIREQIKFRLNFTDVICMESGACVKCGCMVPALQFANKSCGGDCYPDMLSAIEWARLKEGLVHIEKDKGLSWQLNTWNDYKLTKINLHTREKDERISKPNQGSWYR